MHIGKLIILYNYIIIYSSSTFTHVLNYRTLEDVQLTSMTYNYSGQD